MATRTQGKVPFGDAFAMAAKFVGGFSGMAIIFFIVLQLILQVLYQGKVVLPLFLVALLVVTLAGYLVTLLLGKLFYEILVHSVQSFINGGVLISLIVWSFSDDSVRSMYLVTLEAITLGFGVVVYLSPLIWHQLSANAKAEVEYFLAQVIKT